MVSGPGGVGVSAGASAGARGSAGAHAMKDYETNKNFNILKVLVKFVIKSLIINVI